MCATEGHSVIITMDVASCRLEEAGVLTYCGIRTLEAEETLDFDFCTANVLNKVILKVNALRPWLDYGMMG